MTVVFSRRAVLGAALPMLAAPSAASAQPVPPPPAYTVVPPLRHEGPPPPPPGSGYIWRPGHWQWDGRRYDWAGGSYVHRAQGWHEYVPGHWIRRGPEWVWVAPHWR